MKIYFNLIPSVEGDAGVQDIALTAPHSTLQDLGLKPAGRLKRALVDPALSFGFPRKWFRGKMCASRNN
jgi:hypothetical protein